MPLDLTLPPPAIVHSWTIERRYGFNNDPLTALRLDPDAKISDLPAELLKIPLAVLATFMVSPLIGFGGGSLFKRTVLLTTTSASNQSWTILGDWTSLDNYVEVYSAGGNGRGGTSNGGGSNDAGGGGGGGGYAKTANITLTPNASTSYRLRAGGAGTGTTNACWFGGTTLAGSSVGVQCGATSGSSTGGAGALTTSAIGDTKRAGGTGGTGQSGQPNPNGGGGGGCAGSSAVGSAGSGSTPGAGGGGSAGTGGNGGAAGNNGSTGSVYGSGGGGGSATDDVAGSGAAGEQALIVIVNNASLA